MNFPKRCPECGSDNLVRFEEPGYDHEGHPVPDWSCEACGFAGFDTANRQEDEFRRLQEERNAYHQETGFVLPCKPALTIMPEYLSRTQRFADVEPEVIVNGWVCRTIDKDTLECPACHGTMPIGGVPNGDCYYEPDWTGELFEELEPTIRQAFKVEDALTDFFICQNCFNAGEQLAPRPWLQEWVTRGHDRPGTEGTTP